MHQNRREKAIQILEEFCKDIKLEPYQYFITIKDADDDENPERDTDSGYYCEECIKKFIEIYRNEHRNIPAAWIDSDCFRADQFEQNGFAYCDLCGVHFSTCLLLADEELNHWESLESLDFQKESNNAYELKEILENDNEFTERVDKLAARVIAEIQK